LQISRSIGFRASESVISNNLGVIFNSRGAYDQAREQFERSLRIKREVNDREGIALAGANLGLIYHHLGDYETARRHCEEAGALAREIGARHVEANALANLGRAFIGLDQLPQATAAFTTALELRQALNELNLAPQAQAGLAEAALLADDPATALTYAEAILAYMAENELETAVDPLRIYHIVYQTLWANGDEARATAVLREAYADMEAQGAKISDAELRRSFFENIPAHRAIRAAWRELAT
jgi:hypothetical protein